MRLYRKDPEENERIKREVSVLSRLHNIHIVRYFHTWIETVEDIKEIEELGFSTEEEGFNLESDSSEEDEEVDDSYGR